MRVTGPAALVLAAAVLAACGGGPAGPSPTATGPAASGGAPASPGAEAPTATPWPGHVVEAIVLLGTSDEQVKAAGADLGAAAQTQDLEAMWGAADGFVQLLEKMEPQVDRLRDDPVAAELVAAYDAALPDMHDGAVRLRDSITAGDAAGVTAGSQQLSRGIDEYAKVRPILVEMVEQAVLMQRILVK